MMGGAGRSMGRRSLETTGAIAIERPAQWIDDASDQSVAHRHVHHMTPALDLIARMQLPVVAKQHDADFVFIDVECDAIHSPGNFSTSSKPTPGRPETLAMPVAMLVIVPTSRGVSCGAKASSRLAYSSERAVETRFCEAAQVPWSVIGSSFAGLDFGSAWLRFLGFRRLGFGFRFGSFSFRSSPTLFSSDAR